MEQDGQTPLHRAVWNDNSEVVRALLAGGVEVGPEDKVSYLFVCLICGSGHPLTCTRLALCPNLLTTPHGCGGTCACD